MKNEIINHYDLLIDEGNDPVLDLPELQSYMDKWDGKMLIDLLELDERKSVLEIGCGTGRLAIRVAPHVKRFCGIDLSPKTIEAAKRHLSDVDLICDDFLTHKFSSKFDVIYSSLTFMHIQNKGGAIRKIYDLLLDNGKVVLSIDKNQSKIIDYGARKITVYPDTSDSIFELLKKQNFSEINQYETEFAYIIVANK